MNKCTDKHNLVVIYQNFLQYETVEVVRWCQDCGAIVVDLDFDGRTLPGKIMRMHFPKNMISDVNSD